MLLLRSCSHQETSSSYLEFKWRYSCPAAPCVVFKKNPWSPHLDCWGRRWVILDPNISLLQCWEAEAAAQENVTSGEGHDKEKRSIFLEKTPKVTHSAQASICCWEWSWEYQNKNLSGPCSNFWYHSLTKNKPKALSGRVTLAKYFLSPTKTTEISRNFCLWPKWNKTSTYYYPTFSVLLQSFFLYHVVSLPGQVAVII